MHRYAIEQDTHRKDAGWGDWSWVVDRSRDKPDNAIRLLPTPEAVKLAEKMNAKTRYPWAIPFMFIGGTIAIGTMAVYYYG